MQDRPTATELLQAIATLLENELLPALDGPLQYRTRVAASLTRILERESIQGNRLLVEERQALLDLLGLDAQDQLPGPLAEQVADLNQQLVDELARQPTPEREAAIWDALYGIARGKLAIARPGYDDYDAASEVA